MKSNQSNIKKAKNYLDKDHCIGVPTETVYGLAGNAYSSLAVKKIFRLKKRPTNNPLIVHYLNLNLLKKDCLINNNFLKPFNKNFKSFKQRQKLPKFYYPTGSIYTFWRKTLETSGNFYGSKIKSLIIPNEESIDVDDIFDLFICENILKNWKNYKKTFLKRSVKV